MNQPTFKQRLCPMICPHCGAVSTDEDPDIKIDYDRAFDGVRIGGTKWQCPKCEMVVHQTDKEI